MTSSLVTSEIQRDIQKIEWDIALDEEINFNHRADAIDFIDFHILDRLAGLWQLEANENLDALQRRAVKVKDNLETIDTNLFIRLREEIANGMITKSSFKKMIRDYLGENALALSQPGSTGYDNLDTFINGILFDRAAVPEPTLAREPDMVAFQKVPARIVFEMATRAHPLPHDVFFDLGSGLGQAVMLMNLISGISAWGIEYEPAYHHYAAACASRLNLSNAQFINADAREADYSQGTIFFMYTPFQGHMLQAVLDRLQKESQERTIRIFSYGPCSRHLAQQCWLRRVGNLTDDSYRHQQFTNSNGSSLHLQ